MGIISKVHDYKVKPISFIESIQQIDIVRNLNVILGVLNALNTNEWLKRRPFERATTVYIKDFFKK